jgi:hypothetical protein
MYYILTTLLSTIQGSAGQLCGLDPGNFYQYPVITLFLYQRLVLGAKGKEQIPNYSFWQDFGNLQAVSLILRLVKKRYTVTCGRSVVFSAYSDFLHQ